MKHGLAFLVVILAGGMAAKAHAAPPPPSAVPGLARIPPPPNYAKYYPGGNMSLPPTAVLTGQLGYKAMLAQQAEKQVAALAASSTNAPAPNMAVLQPEIVVRVVRFGDGPEAIPAAASGP